MNTQERLQQRIDSMLLTVTIKKFAKGGYFHKVSSNGKIGKKIWCKGDYCRYNKAYECVDVDDINNFAYLKGSKKVFAAEY